MSSPLHWMKLSATDVACVQRCARMPFLKCVTAELISLIVTTAWSAGRVRAIVRLRPSLCAPGSAARRVSSEERLRTANLHADAINRQCANSCRQVFQNTRISLRRPGYPEPSCCINAGTNVPIAKEPTCASERNLPLRSSSLALWRSPKGGPACDRSTRRWADVSRRT